MRPLITMIREIRGHVYIFRFYDRVEAMRAFGRCAADPRTEFSWYDAAAMSAELRREFTNAANSR